MECHILTYKQLIAFELDGKKMKIKIGCMGPTCPMNNSNQSFLSSDHYSEADKSMYHMILCIYFWELIHLNSDLNYYHFGWPISIRRNKNVQNYYRFHSKCSTSLGLKWKSGLRQNEHEPNNRRKTHNNNITINEFDSFWCRPNLINRYRPQHELDLNICIPNTWTKHPDDDIVKW